MSVTPATIVAYKIASKGATAQLREIAEGCEDRETMRVLYTELRRITHQMAHKHGFDLASNGKRERIVSGKCGTM